MSDGNLGGRPSHEPTEQNRKTAEMLSGKGSTQEEIAALLDVSVETLVKYYRRDLKLGKAKANHKVARALWDKAISKTHPQSVTAGIWWTKTQMSWKEPRQDIGVSTPDGPLESQVSIVDAVAEFDRRLAVRIASRKRREGDEGSASGMEGGESV